MKVIGKDTVFTVSAKQLRSNNNAIADLKACNEVADTLFAQKERYKDISAEKSKALIISDSLAKNYQQQVVEKKITEESYKKEAKRSGIKVRFLKGFASGFGIIAIVEAGYISLTQFIKK